MNEAELSREGAPELLVPYLRRNGFSKLKEVVFSIFFGRHALESDAHEALAFLQDSEYFTPEVVNWDEGTEDLYNGISQGVLSPPQGKILESQGFMNHPFQEAILEGIRNSGKIIALADVSQKSGVISDEAEERFRSLPADIITKKWSRAAARTLMVARREKILGLMNKREAYIAENIGPAIVRNARYDSESAGRTSLRAGMSLGTDHVSILPLLEAIQPDIRTGFQKVERYTTYNDKLNEAINKGMPVSEEDADGALTEMLIDASLADVLQAKSANGTEWEYAVNTLAKAMNDPQREIFHRLFMSGKETLTKEFIKAVAQEKGLL